MIVIPHTVDTVLLHTVSDQCRQMGNTTGKCQRKYEAEVISCDKRYIMFIFVLSVTSLLVPKYLFLDRGDVSNLLLM